MKNKETVENPYKVEQRLLFNWPRHSRNVNLINNKGTELWSGLTAGTVRKIYRNRVIVAWDDGTVTNSTAIFLTKSTIRGDKYYRKPKPNGRTNGSRKEKSTT